MKNREFNSDLFPDWGFGDMISNSIQKDLNEQESIQHFVPVIADMIIEYERADFKRQVEIISEFVKESIMFELDGLFQRAYLQLIENGWINQDGKILKDLDSMEL